MIGEKIHSYRKEAKKTLAQIAELTGLSASYLSQLERNKIDPSLSALRKIAEALDIPVFLFLEEEKNEGQGYVLQKKDRILMNFADGTTTYEVASTMPNKTVTPAALMLFCTLQPKTYDTNVFVTHAADEIVLAYEGELTVLCGSSSAIIREGDTVFIPRNTPHRYYNHTDSVSSAYVVTSPCAWPSRNGCTTP